MNQGGEPLRMRRLFGTDGIRGVAGEFPLDQATAAALGSGAGAVDSRHERSHPEVVIGMDTREIGPWIAEHVAGGLAHEGVGAQFRGIDLDAGLAHVAKVGPFAAGVMISASHNPYHDNGIKVIDHSGFKLPDEQSTGWSSGYSLVAVGNAAAPETLVVDPAFGPRICRVPGGHLAGGLRGVGMVVERQRAAQFLAPDLFERLGAKSTYRLLAGRPQHQSELRIAAPGRLARRRFSKLARTLGVAFDGDADRALFVSHRERSSTAMR